MSSHLSASPRGSGGAAVPLAARRLSSRRIHFYLAWAAALPLLVSAVTGTLYRVLRSWGFEKVQVKWLMRVHTLEVLGLRSVYPLLLMSAVAVLLVTGFSMTYIWVWLRARCSRRRRNPSDHRNLSRALEQYESQRQSKQLLNPASAEAGDSLPGEVPMASSVGTAEEESEWSEAEEALNLGGGSNSASVAVLNRYVPPSLTPRWTWRQRLQSLLPPRFTWRWAHRVMGTLVLIPLTLTTLTGGAYIVASDYLYWEKPEYKWMMYLHEGRYLEASGTLYVALMGPAVVTLIGAGSYMLYNQSCRSAVGGAVAGAGAAAAGGGAYGRASSAAVSHLSPSSLAYSRVAALNAAAAAPPSADTRKALARIQKAFDITADDGSSTAGEDTEDELSIGGGAGI